MQKVEGSNPFSRFRKGLHLQVSFVRAVGWSVCIDGYLGDETSHQAGEDPMSHRARGTA